MILNRNPLDNISSTTDIYRVIQSGKVVDGEALTKWQESVPRPGARSMTPVRKNGWELSVVGEKI